jgi:hypothetical protein
MYHFATALSAVIIATVLVSGTAFVPTPAEAAKMSKADKIALKQTTAACKAEVKGMKVRWPASRKYVKNCIIRTAALKDRPNMNITQVRSTVDRKRLRMHRSPEWGCDPMC